PEGGTRRARSDARNGLTWKRERRHRSACQVLQHEWLRRTLTGDSRVRSVTGMNDRLVAKRKEHSRDRSHQDAVVAAREIGPADRAGKQRVADEQVIAFLFA